MAGPKPIRATPGTVSHDGRPMKYAHGQHAAYVLDKCRCTPCRTSNTAYELDRSLRAEPAYVSAGDARAHIEWLRTQGLGLKTIAKVSGVSHGALSKLIYGSSERGTGPSKRIRQESHDRIMAVTPADIAAGAAQAIPAGPTWALVDEMVAAGIPKVRIAERLGQAGPGLQLSRTTISPGNRDAVAAAHADWKAGRWVPIRRDCWGNQTTIAAAAPTRADVLADRMERARQYTDIVEELASVVEARVARPWRNSAACRGVNPSLFFPQRGDRITTAAARKVCEHCTVRQQCILDTLGEREGMYGGITPKRRQRLAAALDDRPGSDLVIRSMKGVYVIEHGTIEGYRDHLHMGTDPCDACKRAASDAQSRRRAEAAAMRSR